MADAMQVPSSANEIRASSLYRHEELDVCAELHQDDQHVVGASIGGLELKRRLLTKVVVYFDPVIGVCGILQSYQNNSGEEPGRHLSLPDACHTDKILELIGSVGCKGVSTFAMHVKRIIPGMF